MLYIIRRAVAAILVSLVCLASPSPLGAQPAAVHDPSLRVVVIIDRSGTYRGRFTAAIERAIVLLERLAAMKVHAWEPANDRIALIALDALPGVIWSGSLPELKALNRKIWEDRFRSRSDFEGCTDVASAFQIATTALGPGGPDVKKYLFVFSDLQDEPPTTSVRVCRPPQRPSLPPQEFPWEALSDIAVSVMWVPADQVLAWRRVIESRKLSASFNLYSESESGSVTLTAPPRPKATLTVEEQRAGRAKYAGYAAMLLKGVGTIAGILLVVVIAIVAAALWRRHQRHLGGGRGRSAIGMRRAGAAVPPLTLPGGPRPILRRPTSGAGARPEQPQ